MFKTVWTILQKDLWIERQTRESLTTMIVFSIIVLVVFNFTLDPGLEQVLTVGPGILWVAFIFAGNLGLTRTFASESENGNLQALVMTPVDKGLIYLGKLSSAFIFMFSVELILLPLFVIFFNLHFTWTLVDLAMVCILGTLGFTSAGTMFSAIALNTRIREIILPLLLLPVTVPVIIASVESTAGLLRGESWSEIADWIKLLAAFDIIMMVGSFLTFENVLSE